MRNKNGNGKYVQLSRVNDTIFQILFSWKLMFKWKNLFAICYRISVFVSLRYYSVDYYLAIFTYIWKIFKFDLFKNLRKHFILYIFDLFFSRKITICTIICVYVWIYRLKIIDTWWLELIQTGFRMNKLKKNY